ncbi:MAG: peptide chain release factor N(5)-glutamine methyltransferase, partial [candidate division NC10 bacterium]|nr:peptide chain release factor N(5)-glutamine methyltransferase [candidate division NC10 bacterium]
RLDAECLLASLLGRDRLHLYAAAEERMPPPVFEVYRALLGRRRVREPLAYLTGTKEFWSLSFGVTPDVLIPRPETETLVEMALARLNELQAPVIADIGTGSGAIAVALATALPHSRLYATEISSRALDVARANAARHGVLERITFLHGDLVEPLFCPGVGLQCDLMVSNPPYVATEELAGLPPEVRYEPLEALDGGPDGLDVHRRLISGASTLLKPGGWLALEMTPGQGVALSRLLREQGVFGDIEVTPDLSGRERVIVARCTGPGLVRSGVRFGLSEEAGRTQGG